MQVLVFVLVLCLVAAISNSENELCGEDTCAIANDGSDLYVSESAMQKSTRANPASRDAPQKRRRRRVGFSHEDMKRDEYLRPLLATFRDSLSGRAGIELDSEYLHATGPPPLGNSGSGDVGEEVVSSNPRRHLAATHPAEDPYFYPSGGTYHNPIAVSLMSSANSIIFYTTDGTSPDASSDFVLSGELIVVEDSITLRAIAAYKDSSFESLSSAEIQATFVVYMEGKCGHAYFVPHFTSSGYSGKVVEVDLNTNSLGSVRLHGVVTDFADFYASGGVGPYAGQVVMDDLDAEGGGKLTGYWGGFSGEVDGIALGFLSPRSNGDGFHGKAIQINLQNFGGTNDTRFCGSAGVLESNSTCTYTVLDLEKVDPDLRGFSGGFLHDSKAYFVPSNNGRGAGAKIVRVDAGNFSSDSVEVLDLQAVDREVGGFYGGFAWEGYGYLIPSRSFKGPVGGVNTNMSADGVDSSASFMGNDLSPSQKQTAGRLQPAYSGKLVQVDLTDYSPSGVQVLDLTKIDPDLRGFTGGFAVGHWGFLVPFKNREVDGEFSGKMVRFDLLTFDYASVTVLDLTRVKESLRGFVGGFAHGRYAILSPYSNENTTGNYRGTSQFGQMVAVDLQDFTVESVSVVDLAYTRRQQIPYQSDPNLRGYVGGFSLGPHVYFTPHFNGVFFGKIARVDMREMLAMAKGEPGGTYDGLQVLDLELDSSDAVGFSGAFHSWDTSCYNQ